MAYNKEYYCLHRKDILDKQHEYYWNDPERYRQYCKEYKRKNRNKQKIYKLNYNLSPAGIWTNLKKISRKISKEDFIKWYVSQPKKCSYCGVAEKEFKGRKFRCWNIRRLQVDRKDNKNFYTIGNIVLACPVCNWIKGDYFTYSEMLKIGKVIKVIMARKNRL